MDRKENAYQEIVTRTLDVLTRELHGYVRAQLESAFGHNWLEAARSSCRNDRNVDELPSDIREWDAHALLTVMWDQWNAAFRRKLGLFERSLVAELRAFRNRWAHQKYFNFDDAYRLLDSAHRLLKAIGAPCSADLSELKFELLKDEFGEAINAQSRELENSRDRWVVAAVYLSCGMVFCYLIPHTFGTHTWPLSVAFGVAFVYLVYKRMKWKPPQIGPHECRRCRRIIYGTNCPYCSEPPAFDSLELGPAEGDSEVSDSTVRRLVARS